MEGSEREHLRKRAASDAQVEYGRYRRAAYVPPDTVTMRETGPNAVRAEQLARRMRTLNRIDSDGERSDGPATPTPRGI